MDKQASEKIQKKVQPGHIVTIKDLGISLGDSSASSEAFSTWVRTLSQNWRQGTVSCKGRSDVARSGRKPWKQKGTGRARAGSARSPIWRGGGVTFGPQARVRSLRVSKKLKRKVLAGMLVEYLAAKKISSIDWSLEGDSPKTSAAYSALKKVGLHEKKVVLFLPADDRFVRASYANIANVNILFFDQANAFDLANSSHWLYLKKDADAFKDMVSRWI